MVNNSSLYKKLSVWQVSKFAFLGVPITLKQLQFPWKEIMTPRFPLFFSILGWFSITIFGFVLDIFELNLFQEKNVVSEIGAYAFYCFAGFGIYVWIPIVVNVLLFCWCFIILLFFKKISKININIIYGSRRVIYFSAFFQMFYLFTSYYYLVWEAKTTTGETSEIIRLLLLIFMIVTALLRIGAVFQGIRRETNGNVWAGLLSVIGCTDIWLLSLFL